MFTIYFYVNMSSVVATRLEDSEVKEIKHLAKVSHLDQSSLVKTILRTGVQEFKLNMALEKYKKKQISLGKASELAGVSIFELLEKFESHDIHLSYDLLELEKDMKTLKKL